jgi:MFS family permease
MTVQAAEATTASVGAPALPARAYRRYALILLMLIYVFNMIDRQVVSILAEPIKRDLNLADWQLGLMTGLAFALLYTVMGLPVARWAERGDRPLIISGAVALWSLFTAASGFAQNFAHLLLARVGVGIGEAGCTPPALSLIADTVPRENRASATAVYMLGAPIGSLLGLALGGLIADAYGWRMAFLGVGLPGLVLAVIAALTLREPRRGRPKMAAPTEATDFRAALRELNMKRAYKCIVGAITISAFVTYGALAFTGSFFFRNHGTALAEAAAQFGLKSAGFLGISLGVTSGLMAIIGTLLGGFLGDYFARRDIRAFVVIPAAGAILGLPFSIAAVLTDSFGLALILLLIPGLLSGLALGPAYGVIQSLVQPTTRATATAVLLFVSNLIGLGLGPLSLGLFSDFLAGQGLSSGEALRMALLIFGLLALPCAALFWTARRTLREEIVS